MRRLLAVLILLAAAGVVVLPAQAETEAEAGSGQSVRGWTILSDSDAGADAVIAAAKPYRINHLQLSHEIVHDLREVREPAKQAQANRLVKAAHDAGIAEVAIWDHSLYDLDHYPAEFRTGPDGTIDLDDPAFWQWFKQDYREMLDLVPDIDSVVLTFIETGARVERQHSAKLTTAEQKLAYLVDQVAEVIVNERGLGLYLRTFGYFPEEMERTIGAIALVRNPDVKVMAKATPHDFFLTHPNDSTIARIDRPVLVEYDTAGEYNGQGKIANAWPEEHVRRLRHYQGLPNVIGYVARTDRYGESRIVGTPTEINLYALARATEDRRVSVETIYREFAARTYGKPAAREVAAALSKSYEIVTSVLYSLGTNTANHSRLDYEPYCSSYHRSVSGKWIEPPVTYVRHGVNKRFHFWIDVVDQLSPAACKADPTLAREAQYVLDRGWVTPGDHLTPAYLRHVLTEKDHGVRMAESALRDIGKARRHLSAEHFQQLTAYFERTLLTARLHRAVAAAYFGYRVYVRDAEQRTRAMRRLIWDGLDDSRRIAEQIRTYPVPAASGEWDWVRDAAEADTYYDRISKGWDRYGGITVPRP